MKRIHADDAKQSTQIDFLPAIKGYPDDFNPIFTTLKQCIELYLQIRDGDWILLQSMPLNHSDIRCAQVRASSNTGRHGS